jgi:acyl-coenzyme A thioesterase PaaI-like protein
LTLRTPAEFLGGATDEDGRWRFAIGRELHGAFGGAFGGAVAAACLIAARPLVEGRVPASLDCRFLRGLPAGTATAVPSIVHRGRTLSFVSVDLAGPDGKLAARTAISFVAPEAVRPLDRAAAPIPDPDAGAPWRQPPGVEIPIVTTLAPRILGHDDRGVATAVRIPWTERSPATSAEAVCLAADMCVGPPVAAAFPEQWIPHPNPDLSLRFAASASGDDVIGYGRLDTIAAGIAVVRVEVRSAGELVATGVSCSLLLAGTA